MVTILLDHGADVDDADTLGWTALHNASHRNQAETADVLEAAGADITASDRERRTPVHCAATNSRNDVLRSLLQRGAKTVEVDVHGKIALYLVCAEEPSDAVETVDLRLRAGASESAVGMGGSLPVEDARGATDVAREQVVQRIRELLRHAPADRAWRRRCWLLFRPPPRPLQGNPTGAPCVR